MVDLRRERYCRRFEGILGGKDELDMDFAFLWFRGQLALHFDRSDIQRVVTYVVR